jgi:hypothetical protein
MGNDVTVTLGVLLELSLSYLTAVPGRTAASGNANTPVVVGGAAATSAIPAVVRKRARSPAPSGSMVTPSARPKWKPA